MTRALFHHSDYSFNPSDEPCPGTCADVHDTSKYNLNENDTINNGLNQVTINSDNESFGEPGSPCKYQFKSDDCYTCR